MKKLFIILLIFFSCGDNAEEITEDPIIGDWTAFPWYCNNELFCNVNPVDQDSYLSFTINSIDKDGRIDIQNINWYLPSGNNDISITGTEPGVAYIFEDKMVINFTTIPPSHFQYLGDLTGEIFIGAVRYAYDDPVTGLIAYEFNDHVIMEKK